MSVRETGPALTPAQIEEGKRLLKEGASLRDLARRFNVSAPTIKHWCGPAVVERRGRKKSRALQSWI